MKFVFELTYRRSGIYARYGVNHEYFHAENLLEAENMAVAFHKKISEYPFSISRIRRCSLIDEVSHMMMKDISIANEPEGVEGELEFDDDLVQDIIDTVHDVVTSNEDGDWL